MQTNVSEPELRAWCRLSMEPGLGPAQARALLAAIGLPQDIFATSANSLQRLVAEPIARQLAAPPTTEISERIENTLLWLTQANNHIITLADQSYPSGLLETSDPPLIIYAKGRIELLSGPNLAIVGSRNCTQPGKENAMAFAHNLASSGWSIVSGLAVGIDTAAHTGALQALKEKHNGSTIAVLATGADLVYPARNRELAHEIADKGLIITELPLGSPARPFQFPRRNRIVAGISEGVLVVEAARQSGSLTTAKMAAELGREVFAIPGSIHSPLSRGCHALIRQGAKLVESAQDISEELSIPQLPGVQPKTYTNTQLSKQQQQILQALGYDPAHPDTLIERTGIDISSLVSSLAELELDNQVVRLPNGCYQRV